MAQRMPRLVVFDLDYTLWPLWIDTHVSPPLKVRTKTTLVDRSGTEISFYKDVPAILSSLQQKSVKIGVASRTSAPDLARQALDLIQVGDTAAKAMSFFDAAAIEIYPGSKLTHFRAIHKKTEIPYTDMVFFDDERRNIEVAKLGVTFVLVPEGVNASVFHRGLEDWRKNRSVVEEKP